MSSSSSCSMRLRTMNVLRSRSIPVGTGARSVTTIWRNRGITARAVTPRQSGRTGTSRQATTPSPSSSTMLSIAACAFSAASVSTGRNARPTAYWPGGGRMSPSSPRRKRSGTWTRMPAPSPVSGSAPVAPRWSRLVSAVSAVSTSWRLATPLQMGDERDAARVVLEAWVVQAVPLRRSGRGCAAFGCRPRPRKSKVGLGGARDDSGPNGEPQSRGSTSVSDRALVRPGCLVRRGVGRGERRSGWRRRPRPGRRR